MAQYLSEGNFHSYMRGAVLRHVTSQHYVFSHNLNQGQGQRSKVKGQGQLKSI